MLRTVSLIFAVLPILVSAQSGRLNKYWIEFTDKDHSPYCICRPAELLSARALERRYRAGIVLDETDIPVTPAYLDSLKSAGARIHLTSRWLNAAAVIADSATAQKLRMFAFVDTVQYVGPDISIKNEPNPAPRKRKSYKKIPEPASAQNPFGYSALQLSMLNLPLLHFAGHKGEGIWVAVFDGGFSNADLIPFFDSIDLDGRMISARDFVEHDAYVYESASHGTSVLSAMAADVPGTLVGGAPDATYFLFKTEDTGGEFPIEECNWVAAAEYADSLGIDVINASLGYTAYNDTMLSHNFSVLDGRTSISSRGAAIAAGKGMIICNSAGNSGDEPWRHIGVPADAQGLVAVGALEFDGNRATFSSVGPTSDGRIKPDLSAAGQEVVVAGNKDYELGVSSGTSLASPILAGGIAALWSAFPDKTASEILDAVYASADQSENPDNERGYGLPDLARAWGTLAGFVNEVYYNDARGGFFASDPGAGTLTVWDLDRSGPPVSLQLFDIYGKHLAYRGYTYSSQEVSRVELNGLEELPPGACRLEWTTESGAVKNYLILNWR